MPTMKSVVAATPGTIEVTETRRPVPGPRDVLLKVRACGTDAIFVQMGGMPLGPGGQITAIPLGHERRRDHRDRGAGHRPEARRPGGHQPAGRTVGHHRLRRGPGRHERVPAHRERPRGHEPGGLPGHRALRDRRAERADGPRPALREPLPSPDRGQGRRVRRRAHRAGNGDMAETGRGPARRGRRHHPRAPADSPGRGRGRGHRLLPRGRDRPAHRTARPQHQHARPAPPGHRHLHRRGPRYRHRRCRQHRAAGGQVGRQAGHRRKCTPSPSPSISARCCAAR